MNKVTLRGTEIFTVTNGQDTPTRKRLSTMTATEVLSVANGALSYGKTPLADALYAWQHRVRRQEQVGGDAA